MVSNYELLERLHRELQPRGYLEIGVRWGDSLKLAQCVAIGVDPAAQIAPLRQGPVPMLYEMTSDEFFTQAPVTGALERFDLDLVYIDGMHLYEYALRDFINVIRYANPRTVVVFDDTHPYSQSIATRQQPPGDWTGDVWKVMDVIERATDFQAQTAQVDVSPTGAFVVWDIFSPDGLPPVDDGWMVDMPVPDDILDRRNTITPDELITAILEDRS